MTDDLRADYTPRSRELDIHKVGFTLKKENGKSIPIGV